jgi:hypothetical protein
MKLAILASILASAAAFAPAQNAARGSVALSAKTSAVKPKAKVALKPKAKVALKPKAKVAVKPKAKVIKPKAKVVKPKAKVVVKKLVNKVTMTAAKGKSVGFANEVGVQQPLGFWDPLGLLADGDQERFDRLRYVEIKHGRICMLAVVGYLTAESGIRLPGVIDSAGTTFESIPNGFAALSAVPGAGIAQILAFIGYLEIAVWKQDPNSFPGDFGASSFPVGFLPAVKTPEAQLNKRAVELNQGRAAQMGILALMVHEQLGVSILPPH